MPILIGLLVNFVFVVIFLPLHAINENIKTSSSKKNTELF